MDIEFTLFLRNIESLVRFVTQKGNKERKVPILWVKIVYLLLAKTNNVFYKCLIIFKDTFATIKHMYIKFPIIFDHYISVKDEQQQILQANAFIAVVSLLCRPLYIIHIGIV